MFLFQPDFSAAVRTLTGLGTAIQLSQGVNLTIAATSTVSFTSGASTKSAKYSMAATAPAGGTIVIQFTDGTNTWTAVTIAVSTTGGQDVTIGNNLVIWQMHNNSATSGTYWYAGEIYSQ